MSGNGRCFVEWKEEFVSQERGNRVVHYFLKDSAGESILAVVGTERSLRHMFYVVAEDFLEVHGMGSTIHSGFKWRSRREVVDWLTSMLSKQYLTGDPSGIHGSTQTAGIPERPSTGVSALHIQALGDQDHRLKNFKGRDSDIVWSGIAWTCGKQLKHYSAFCRNGITIGIQSFVFVMAKGENQYIAYLEDMYEDKRCQKRVKVRWFHHNQEVKGISPLRNPHPKEVFITPYAQVISAECVDGPATVLTREHYQKCLDALPHAFLARIHLCYRQFRSNRVKPFDLSKLRGYSKQPIISCLDSDSFLKPDYISSGLTGEDNDELNLDESARVGAKRIRSTNDPSKVRNHARDGQMFTYGPHQDLNDGLAGRGLVSLKHVGSQPWFSPPFNVDQEIEVLCQDSGIRGCWFRCRILQVSRKQLKVRYDDVQDEDGCGNLEEWIPAFKLAAPDKIGMRYSSRPTIRPAPVKDQTNLVTEIGAAVDAWWSDGWWEGVVTGVDRCSSSLQVFFPGETLLLNIHKNDLRVSRDWLGDQWIGIKSKPEIVSAISATISSETKPSGSSAYEDIKSVGLPLSCVEDPATTRQIVVDEENINLTTSASSDGLCKDINLLSSDKSPSLEEGIGNLDGGDAKDSCDNVDNVKGNHDDDKDNNDDRKSGAGMKVCHTSEQSHEAVEAMEVATDGV